MSKINNINPSQTPKFKGLDKMDKPALQNIENLLNNLKKRAEREVPEYGNFSPVCEKFANKDKSLYAGDIEIKVTNVPKNIKDHKKLRFLDIVVKSPSDRSKASCIIACGEKNDVLNKLNDKDLLAQVNDLVVELSKELKEDNFS